MSCLLNISKQVHVSALVPPSWFLQPGNRLSLNWSTCTKSPLLQSLLSLCSQCWFYSKSLIQDLTTLASSLPVLTTALVFSAELLYCLSGNHIFTHLWSCKHDWPLYLECFWPSSQQQSFPNLYRHLFCPPWQPHALLQERTCPCSLRVLLFTWLPH